jgi:hypothetical protein
MCHPSHVNFQAVALCNRILGYVWTAVKRRLLNEVDHLLFEEYGKCESLGIRFEDVLGQTLADAGYIVPR